MFSNTALIPYVPPLSSVEFKKAALSQNAVFLIEGCGLFPELILSHDLAQVNRIGSFDCIHSFDRLHLSQFFASYSARDHKKIAAYIIRMFCKEGSISKIVDNIIKPGLIDLVSKGTCYTAVPEWVDSLKDSSYLLAAFDEIEKNFINKEDMQADYDAIAKALVTISNQISAKAFFEYLKEHPEVRQVYGILGLRHIHFLDEYAVKIDSSVKSCERHLQLLVDNQEVTVHLFGGKHGELSHYEALASFVAEKGLSLPSKPKTPTQEDVNTQLVDALLQNSDEEIEPVERRLQKAVKKFDYWMKKYTHFGANEEELLDWLYCDAGGELISSFEEFKKLAHKIDENGYVIKTMPTQEKFDKALAIFTQRKEEEDSSETIPLERRLQKAVKKFDYWMKKYTHFGAKNNEEELLDWLYCDGGGELIFCFEEFKKLAHKIDENGYVIKTMPTQEKFDKAMAIFTQRKEEDSSEPIPSPI